jgi:hypothetical protein
MPDHEPADQPWSANKFSAYRQMLKSLGCLRLMVGHLLGRFRRGFDLDAEICAFFNTSFYIAIDSLVSQSILP